MGGCMHECGWSSVVLLLTDVSVSDVDAGLVEDLTDGWVTLVVGVVGHGGPGEIHGVDGDDRRLQQTGAGVGWK